MMRRWLLRLVPLVVILALGLFVVGAWAIIRNVKTTQTTLVQVRKVNARQSATLRMLCDRGYILDGLVEAAIALVNAPPNPPADREFVREFELYHAELISQLSQPGSPCVQK